jgi:hypothetical protein
MNTDMSTVLLSSLAIPAIPHTSFHRSFERMELAENSNINLFLKPESMQNLLPNYLNFSCLT